MNPNNPNNLDPKLRQAYESIMSGTPTQTPAQPVQSQPQAPISQPAPQQQQPQAPQMQTEVIPEQPAVGSPPINFTSAPPDDVLQSPLYNQTMANPNPSAADAQEAIAPKKKNKFLPFFLGIGIFVFFIVYAVVWSKVFGLF